MCGSRTVERSHERPSPIVRFVALIVGLTTGGNFVMAAGIPEPNLVFYGVISNSADGGARLTAGTLTWILKPADGGNPISLTGSLTNLNEQFSYVLRVPCESELPGTPVSPGALRLSVSSTGYDRSQVVVNGAPAGFIQPALTNLVLSLADRGRIQRIDLSVGPTADDPLPEAWQLQFFGHTGVDPNDDPDHDGLSNLSEFRAGTDPTNPQSTFEIVSVRANALGGIQVDFSSVAGKFYEVQRSSNFISGFTGIQTHVPAAAPVSSIHDTTATGKGPYFYRLRLEP